MFSTEPIIVFITFEAEEYKAGGRLNYWRVVARQAFLVAQQRLTPYLFLSSRESR